MEATAQTQVLDSQGNLVLASKPALEVTVVTHSPSRSRRAPDSPLIIPADMVDKDPLALKLESALKRSIADRTGDLKLKQEAAFQQSLADKMGARAVMSKEQLERTKKEAEQLRIDAAAKQSTADRTGDAALKKEAAAQQHLADKLIASANKSLAAIAAGADPNSRSASAPSSPALSSPSPSSPATPSPLSASMSEEPSVIVQVLQDALDALLENATQKQRHADKTGDMKLKQEAALAQSKVDKMRSQLTNELKRSSSPVPSPTLNLSIIIPSSPRAVHQPSSPQRSPHHPRAPPAEIQLPSSPLSSPQRSPHPRAPPADLTFTSVVSGGDNKYKPPAQRALQAQQQQQQQQQAVRQRSPQLAQFSLANKEDKKKDDKAVKKEGEKEKKTDKNQSDKPADRAVVAKSWRRRESYTPAPPSPSIPSNENKQPNKESNKKEEVKKLKPLPIKISKPHTDATTNCSEEEFEQQA